MLHENLLKLVGVCAAPDGTNRFAKIGYVIVGVVLEILLTTIVVSSIVFIAKTKNSNSEYTLYALMQLAAFSASITMYMGVFIHRNKLKKILDELNATSVECEF